MHEKPHRAATRRALISGAAAAAIAAVLPGAAFAQAFPAQPIRLIVPFPPGGATDVIGRALALEMSKRLSQQTIVDNRAGAAGIVGVKATTIATPDGYTLVLGSGNSVGADQAQERLPYDPSKELVAIGSVVAIPYVVFANPAFPASNVRELIALAKAQPGKINFASSGTGGAPHLASELLKSQAGIDVVHVAYKGAVPAVNDVVGGQVQFMTGDVNTALPFLQNGRLKALATTGRERLGLLPNVPTVAESGLPGFEAEGWFGVFGPAKIPADVVATLSRTIDASIQDPEFRKRMDVLGGRVLRMTRAEFEQYVVAETRKRSDLIRKNNIVLAN